MAMITLGRKVGYVVYAVSGRGVDSDLNSLVVGAAIHLEVHAAEIVLALLNSVIARREPSGFRCPHTSFHDFEEAIDLAYERGEFPTLITSIRYRLNAWKTLNANTVIFAPNGAQSERHLAPDAIRHTAEAV
jgi:hypothetical protein